MNLTATSASVGLHAAIAFGLMLAAAHDPNDDSSSSRRLPVPEHLVYLLEAGLNGGGKEGSGDSRPNPSYAQNIGSERIALARPTTPDLNPLLIRPPRDSVQEVDVPFVPQETGLRIVPGQITAIVTPETDARGPGNGTTVGAGLESGAGEGDDGRGLGRGRRSGLGDDGTGGAGIDPPVPLRQVKPAYTARALQARLQGVVLMDAVVLPDGSVGDVRIIRSLDRAMGLDEEAVKAVKQWRFRPGTRFGRPVPVLVSVELTFTLR